MDKDATKRAKLKLPRGWSDHSAENPEGPPTYLRDLSCVPGPLQVSMPNYSRSEQLPAVTGEDLQKMCEEDGRKDGLGDLVEAFSGTCDLGMFGTAVFRSADYPRFQIWRVSNGKEFVLVTHICPEDPPQDEIKETEEIVRTLTLSSESKPKWKFW